MILSLRHQEEAAVRPENVLEDRFVGKVKRIADFLEKVGESQGGASVLIHT